MSHFRKKKQTPTTELNIFFRKKFFHRKQEKNNAETERFSSLISIQQFIKNVRNTVIHIGNPKLNFMYLFTFHLRKKLKLVMMNKHRIVFENENATINKTRLIDKVNTESDYKYFVRNIEAMKSVGRFVAKSKRTRKPLKNTHNR